MLQQSLKTHFEPVNKLGTCSLHTCTGSVRLPTDNTATVKGSALALNKGGHTEKHIVL